ncbi:MAG: 4-(cytidine 5'-diphospho)-2-C-methyl-D-erythritol kinase [Desulfuromonas sp.]|nr:MAG: 4-(cytidine 5'-diphospho)-2-C-methyl-D-erythritol kinase [Desulfuromonas sp.]
MKLTRMAPAKINLCLHVLRRRNDGYHDLASLMQRVSLFDQVTVELTDDRQGIRVDSPGLSLADGEENIAGRATRALFDYLGLNRDVRVTIDKQIPVAAGMGGGSSDAAAVLLALNELLGCNLSFEELRPLAAGIGADVPFFLLEHAAWATGIGDELEMVHDLPGVWYLLVNPEIPVSTAKVFGNLGLTSMGDMAKLRGFPSTTEELVRQLHNDLETVTFGLYDEVRKVRDTLIEIGAKGALMSGSGATVFGIFTGRDQAASAETNLVEKYGWWARVVQPLL